MSGYDAPSNQEEQARERIKNLLHDKYWDEDGGIYEADLETRAMELYELVEQAETAARIDGLEKLHLAVAMESHPAFTEPFNAEAAAWVKPIIDKELSKLKGVSND